MKKIIPLTLLLANLTACEKNTHYAEAERESSPQETSESTPSPEEYAESRKAREDAEAKREHSRKFREHFIGKDGEKRIQERNRFEKMPHPSKFDSEPYVDPQDADDFLNDPKMDATLRVRFKSCPGLMVRRLLLDNECRSYKIDPLEYHPVELPNGLYGQIGLEFLTRSDFFTANCFRLATVARAFTVAQENWDRYAEQAKLIDKVIVLNANASSRDRNELCGENLVLGGQMFDDEDAVRLLALSWYKHLPNRQEFEEKWPTCSYEKRSDGSRKISSGILDTVRFVYGFNIPDNFYVGFPNGKNLHEGKGLPPLDWEDREEPILRYAGDAFRTESWSSRLTCVPCLREALPKRIELFLEYGFISQAEHDLALRELQGLGQYTKEDADQKFQERSDYLKENSNRHWSDSKLLGICGDLPKEISPYQPEEPSDMEEDSPAPWEEQPEAKEPPKAFGGEKILI